MTVTKQYQKIYFTKSGERKVSYYTRTYELSGKKGRPKKIFTEEERADIINTYNRNNRNMAKTCREKNISIYLLKSIIE